MTTDNIALTKCCNTKFCVECITTGYTAMNNVIL